MSKLIIQIPCLNEEKTLPVTYAAIPKSLEGIEEIELLVINDGSTDRTIEVARELGVHHVLDLKTHRGLAEAFMEGLLESARLGADYVVNLDADNQYNADDIPKLLEPLLQNKADIVVGERPIKDIETFSWLKRKLQRAGSFVVGKLSKTAVKDTPSGFRAFNRKTMLKLHVFNTYTYTHESLINATESGLRVVGVPVSVNKEVLRGSRLIKSTFKYIIINGLNISRLYLLYNPYPIFITFFFIFGLIGVILLGRFGYHYLTTDGTGLIQSLIIAAISLTLSIISLMMGVFSDILRLNRKLLQKILNELREQHHNRK